MTLTSARVGLALWERKLAYRARLHRYWHRRKSEASQTRAVHWHRSMQSAQREVAKRRRLVQSLTPKPSARGRALREAAKYIGVTEKPSGSNGNPANISKWQSQFGFGRVPWCGIFCGVMMRRAGVKGVTSRIAAVALIEEDAKTKRGPFSGWSTTTRGVLRGDLVVIGGYGVHVEIVEKVLGRNAVQTVGGNTSPGASGSQSNGGGCFRRHRSGGQIRGFAHVNYPNR